jgi:hypothetical protein
VLRVVEQPPAKAVGEDNVAGSTGEAAVTAAADEDDSEVKETGAAGVRSAGEAAVAEPED